jgi:vibriolysin
MIFFNAAASRAATGRRIVSYEWDFGSGRTGTGIATNKGYDTAGTYVVTLTVTDDAGLQGTISQTVRVGPQP